MKDDTNKYPVMSAKDWPEKLIPWLDKRMGDMESSMNEKIDSVVTPCADIKRRHNTLATALRILYLIVFGVIISMVITAC